MHSTTHHRQAKAYDIFNGLYREQGLDRDPNHDDRQAANALVSGPFKDSDADFIAAVRKSLYSLSAVTTSSLDTNPFGLNSEMTLIEMPLAIS